MENKNSLLVVVVVLGIALIGTYNYKQHIKAETIKQQNGWIEEEWPEITTPPPKSPPVTPKESPEVAPPVEPEEDKDKRWRRDQYCPPNG